MTTHNPMNDSTASRQLFWQETEGLPLLRIPISKEAQQMEWRLEHKVKTKTTVKWLVTLWILTQVLFNKTPPLVATFRNL